jgi:hypothetical protein
MFNALSFFSFGPLVCMLRTMRAGPFISSLRHDFKVGMKPVSRTAASTKLRKNTTM